MLEINIKRENDKPGTMRLVSTVLFRLHGLNEKCIQRNASLGNHCSPLCTGSNVMDVSNYIRHVSHLPLMFNQFYTHNEEMYSIALNGMQLSSDTE